MRSRLLLLVLTSALSLPVHAASAHPKLVSSTPAANKTVATAPTSISATFNEPITAALSKLTLFDAAARAVPLDSVTSAVGDSKTLVAKTTTTLAPGRYTVKWQAAGGDGHPMKGEFTFVVAAPGADNQAGRSVGR